jgi:multisubunit Na+/H+ antiporter MnhB subunit
MLASLTSKLLASLLVSALATAAITVVVGQTVLSSHYLEGQLQKSNSYNRLSDALVDQMSQQAASTGNTLVATQLKNIITPVFLKEKINSALDQLQAYYRGNGPQPVIDLTGLAAQAQAAGIPVGEDSGITKPIVLAKNDQARGLSKTFDHVRLSAIISIVVLAALLVLVSWERHRYAALPDVVIALGVLLGLLGLSLWLVPGLLTHVLKPSLTANAFVPIVRDLTFNIVRDLAKRFSTIAGLCLAIGIGTRIWVGRLQAAPQTVPVRSPRPATKK